MKFSRLVLTTITIGATIAFGLGSAPAFADQLGVDEPQALVGSVAPELLGMSDQATKVTITDVSQARSAALGAENAGPSIEAHSPIEDDIDVSFKIDYAVGGAPRESGEFQVFDTNDDGVKAYVQPTVSGVRILTAIASSSAPNEYSYTFDVPDGTVATDAGDGQLRIQSPGSGSLGIVHKAWAKDSSGKELPTAYTWSGKTLTQTIDLSDPDIQYPVLADPNWNYTFEFSIGTTTGSQAMDRLKACFNCFFPVYGAPYDFPSIGETLPLRVGWGGVADLNFTCIMNSWWKYGDGSSGFMFDAAASHIDGEGSWVAFGMYRNYAGQNTLEVSAYIKNDFFLGNWIYTEGARANWQQFADNLSAAIIT